ncbi:hypothetical protein B0J12DRAFT_418914 [Macrophomina phaseolina]|uniref:Sas10/Utp3/C1D n=1 Tax=Macrophomina phaseolina TaxID=35725 RepID=A0ABQ8FU35_9PEZI|nr:hypothetical protein B0J12DRAFT_418914 [Macrophomina phaseolina]
MAAAKADTSLPSLLSSLTASLTSATEPLPSLADGNNGSEDDAAAAARAASFLPPAAGISLLDVKNELLLSYLQNLVFLILLKLRTNGKIRSEKKKEEAGEEEQDVVKKLCELRLYLEKGARPLEGKLKYQIDKVVRAADDAARAEEAAAAARRKGGEPPEKQHKTKAVRAERGDDDDDDEDGSEEDEDSSASDEDDDDDDDIDELAYRPNPAAFARNSNSARDDAKSSNKRESRDAGDGIYRPPRITATAMPEDLPRRGGPRDDDGRGSGPRRAAAIDEFVDEHLSAAPVAQPSIGSNVVAGGRRVKSARERADEEERRAYEETNFVRLPKVGKKERAQQAKRQRGAFGGEEWRELGAGVERIERLTRARDGGRSGTKGALERSRKRAVEDGPRGSGGGAEAGAMFAKRRKMAQRKR